jgi:hypothetical protein
MDNCVSKRLDKALLQGFFRRKCIHLSALHQPLYKQDPKKVKLHGSLKILFIFLEVFRDLLDATIEVASQSSLGTRANLHKVEAAEEASLLGEKAECTASQANRPTPVPTTHPSFPPSATRAKLR